MIMDSYSYKKTSALISLPGLIHPVAVEHISPLPLQATETFALPFETVCQWSLLMFRGLLREIYIPLSDSMRIPTKGSPLASYS